ncbi:MAG: glycosyltransferase family 39 protein [Thermoplasmata archaeon]|nr:MAG: glycosyltransferase family 39 protein [Thermoplasmata archaeon]
MGKTKNNKATPYFIRTKRFFKVDYIILLIVTAIHGVNNYVWLTKDKMIQGWDAAQYLTYSYQYHLLFTDPTRNFFIDFFLINRQRPPLRLIITSPFYGIFGLSVDVAVMTNVIFMIILLFSVYGIGKYLFSREVGLFAAILVSLFPIIHGLSRSFLVDFPSAAMIALSIYLLLKTEYFTNRKYSILFGLSMGLGLLTRDAYPVFMLGPLLYIMYKSSLLKILWLLKTIIKNWYSTIIVAISGAAFGYYLNFLFSKVLWPGDPRTEGMIEILIIIASIIMFIVIWLIWSLVLNVYSRNELKSVLLKSSISFLAFIILIAVTVIPAGTESRTAFSMVPISLVIFGILNFIILKSEYQEWWNRRKNPEFSNHPWLNFFRAIFTGTLVSAWWYIPSANRVFPNMFLNPTYVKPAEGHVNLYSWESVSYYFMGLLNQQLYLFFFVLIICILIVVMRYGRSAIKLIRTEKFLKWPKILVSADWKNKLTLMFWVVVPYIFFSMSHTKNSRYIAPYLPAIAIGMAAALLSFPKRWQKITAVIIVLLMGGFQMITYSYGVPGLPDEVVVNTPAGELLLFGQMPLGRFQYDVHPNDEDWRIDEILIFIYQDYYSIHPGRFDEDEEFKIQVGTITDGKANAYVFRYTVIEEDLPINIQSAAFYETDAWENSSQHSFYKNIKELDYVIELHNFTMRPHHNETAQFFHEEENFNLYEKIKQFDIPEDQMLVVYRRV